MPASCWCSPCDGWKGSTAKRSAARTGFELDALVGEPLQRMVAQGLLADDAGRVRLTREGLFVSDAIWPHFLRA